VVAWDFLYKLDLQKYKCWYNQHLSLIHLVSVEAHLVISWHRVKGLCGTWLRACICEVVDVLRD
jgi:hypothetical protein